MLRRWRTALVRGAILLCTWADLAAQDVGERAQIIVPQANLRVAAALDASIVTTLRQGTVVIVLDKAAVWGRVQVESTRREGWVRLSQIGTSEAGRPWSQSMPDTLEDMTPRLPSRRHEQSTAFFVFAGVSAAGAEWQADRTTHRMGGRRGFTAGAGLELRRGKRVGYEVRLSWVQAGYATRTGVSEVKHSVDYVRASGSVRMVPFGSGLDLIAGPFIGHPIKCRHSVQTASLVNDVSCTALPIGDALQSLDIGGSLGIALALQGIHFVVRYDHSFSDRLSSDEKLQLRGLQAVIEVGL